MVDKDQSLINAVQSVLPKVICALVLVSCYTGMAKS